MSAMDGERDTSSDGPTFEDLGLRPELLRGADRPRLRGAHPHPGGGDPAADRGPRPARPGGHRHRQDGRVRAPGPAAAARATARGGTGRAGARADPRARRPGVRGPAPLRRATSAPACCRSTAARRSAASCASLESGVDVVVATPGRALDLLQPGQPAAGRGRHRGARRGRRDARHGLRRGPRGDPRRDARRRGRRCCSRPPCRAGSTRWPAGTCATRCASRSAASRPQPGRGAAGPPDRLRRPARRQAGRPGPHPGRRVADRGDRLLPHPRGGRLAHRDAQRPRLPRRGAARRHEPGAARPGHGPAPRRDGGPAGRHRRRRPRPGHRPADPRRQLRRPVGAGGLRAPHRPGRPGRAARAWPSPWPSRASTGCSRPSSGSPARRSPSRRCRPSPTCAPAGWS